MMSGGKIVLFVVGGILVAGSVTYLVNDKFRILVDGFVGEIFQGKKTETLQASGYDKDVFDRASVLAEWDEAGDSVSYETRRNPVSGRQEYRRI